MYTIELEYLYTTVIFFGLITFFIYLCLLRPLLAPARHPRPDARVAAAAQRTNADSFSLNTAGAAASSALLCKHTRLPPHVTTPNASVVDGLVSFRHTQAALRSDDFGHKDRARILSKLLITNSSSATISSSLLPPKGSTWIMSIPVHGTTTLNTTTDSANAASLDKIRPVLQVLGTYYNLLVVLAIDCGYETDAVKARSDWIESLRRPGSSATATSTSTGVGEDVLPTHRIVAATTAAGRIAFVRQVQRVGMILDFEATVQEQLSRFGHNVIVYDINHL
jgi:hypothetical protein